MRHGIATSLGSVLALLTFPGVVTAITILVPADQPTIQAGIDAAVDGDVVLVSPGTYFENINFQGKAIQVTSSDGPAVTTILSPLSGDAVTFATGENLDSVLQGFSILNGDGSGIFCFQTSPTITGNIITANVSGNGGGVVCEEGSPLISGNQLIDCVADFGGGILCLLGSTPTIQFNLIRNCVANQIGGGIGCFNSAATIVNNIWDGSELFLYFSDPTLTSNTIVSSLVVCSGGAPVLYNTLFSGSEVLSLNSQPELYFSNLAWGGIGNNNVWFDPQLADPAGGDYHLLFTSAAINFGTEVAPALPDVDIDGDPRNLCGAVDIGADESLICTQAPQFIRGDADGDGIFHGLLDALYLFFAGFVPGSPLPECADAADADDNGSLHLLVDAIYMLNFYFLGTVDLPPPYPTCGIDPTFPDSIGCEIYSACP